MQLDGIGRVQFRVTEPLAGRLRSITISRDAAGRWFASFTADGVLLAFGHPVLRLSALTPEDFYVLLGKLRHVHASGDPARHALPDAGLEAFMAHCHTRIGEAYFRTPRTTITAFVNLLAVLEQNPQADWRALLGTVAVEADPGGTAELAGGGAGATDGEGGDDELASFRL